MTKGYKVLANAIVLQAVDDYRHILRGDRIYQVNEIELKAFFTSKWGQAMLGKISGEWLCQKLEEEAKNGEEMPKTKKTRII